MSDTISDRICVGAFAGSYGVSGEVRLKSFCAKPEAIAGYGPLFSADGSRSFAITLTRAVAGGLGAGGLGARVSGVTTMEQAEALKGVSLFADRARLPRLSDEEFYHSDLIGLEARDTTGSLLGLVTAVHNHGAGDLLEIMGEGRKQALLVPFSLAVVPTVDLAAGRVVVDLPEGLD